MHLVLVQVRDVSENPLARLTMPAEKEGGTGSKRGGGKGSSKQQLETRILENSITKICSLLSVGFGEVRWRLLPFSGA